MASSHTSITVESQPGDLPGWFRVSLPLPAGTARPDRPWSAHSQSPNEVRGLQSRTLATWPDGTVRWLELSGPTTSACLLGLHQEEGPAPAVPAWARQVADGLELGTGDLTLRLSPTGVSPIAWIRHGTETLSATTALTVSGTIGDTDTMQFEADNRALRILQAGPVRSEIEATGNIVNQTGEHLFHYRLRASVVAGQSAITLDFCLTQQTPQAPSWLLHHLQLATHWQPASAARHHVYHPNHTLLCRPREIITESPVEVQATIDHARVHVADTAVFGDEEPWPAYMPDIQDHTEPRLGLGLTHGWVTLAPRDFRELGPKALSVGDQSLVLHIQPQWAEPLVWLQGRSRSTTLDLLFTAEMPSTPQLRQLAAACQPAIARLSADHYANQGIWGMDTLLPTDPPGPRRFSRYLSKLGALPTILGMWDLGDSLDMGYTRTYAANHSTRPLVNRDRPYFRSGNHTPLVEWSGQLTHEPVWANNEYDAILALAREWMRAAPPAEHWQRLRWFGRHAIEVDFVSYSDSPLLHHGTPAHSADHQRATAYPSHLWAEGLLAYYCLTGDDDALDVSIKQGDFILRAFSEARRRDCFWGFNRELGWALLHLAALAGFTGEQRFHDGMLYLANSLTNEFPSSKELDQMVQGAFGYASIALGIHATWVLTQDPRLAQWLVEIAENIAHRVLHEGLECVEPPMILIYFTTAWQVSGDSRHLQPGLHVLEQIMDSKAWTAPTLEVKPVAMLHRGLGTWLGAAWKANLLSDLDFQHYPA